MIFIKLISGYMKKGSIINRSLFIKIIKYYFICCNDKILL